MESQLLDLFLILKSFKKALQINALDTHEYDAKG